MNKQKTYNLIYWAMITIVVITCIYLVFFIRSNSAQCMANPLVYYEAKTNLDCFCVSEFAPYSIPEFVTEQNKNNNIGG